MRRLGRERAGRLAVGAVFLVVAVGCAAPSSPPQVTTSDPVPPVVEGRVPTDYTFLQASAAKRPEWIDTEPADADGTHFLVGMSNYHATERDAREEAMRAAREEFARYTGVEVASVDEVVRSLYGSASDVLDATVAGTAHATQRTDAQVSRIKAWQWYWEKFRATKGGNDRGVAYQAWVLVTVPLSEYARVQEWKEQRANAERARLEVLREAAERERQQLLAEHMRRLDAATQAAAVGDVVRALTLLDSEHRRLGRLAEERAANGGFFLDTAQELRQAQRRLVFRAEEIVAELHLDSGNLGPVCCVLPGTEGKVSAWASLRRGEVHRPAGNLPLVLQTVAGNGVRAVTDASGRADFARAGLAAGTYRLAVDVESAALRDLGEPLKLLLVKVENRLTVVLLPADLDGVVRGLVARLFAGASWAPLPARKVLLGPVTYGEAGQGSEFAFLFKQILAERLTQVPALEVVSPRPRAAEDVARAATSRGLTAGRLPTLGAGATQAMIDGADAVLESVYQVRGDEVTINFALKAAGSDLLLAAASAGVRRETLPAGVQIFPIASDEGGQPADFGRGNIRLEITSHLGDGQTYADGENISYFVRNDRDAYLLLIYEDAAGNLIRILPNRYAGQGKYRAGSTLQIPGRDDGFEFIITAPFGRERVWAFAASVPFPPLAGDELDSGLLLMHGGLEDVLAGVRAVGRIQGVAYGEAQTTITTVDRRVALPARR